MRAITLVFMLLCATPAAAGLTQGQLAQAGFENRSNQSIPENLSFLTSDNQQISLRDVLAGEPGLLFFVDYKCQTLCGVVADQAAAALSSLPWDPAHDYRMVLVGLGEDRGPALAAAFKQDHLAGTRLLATAVALVGVSGSDLTLQRAVGLHALYDAQHDQYAHPTAAVLIDARGQILRYLDPFSLSRFDLRLALTAAGSSGATFADHALTLCYGWAAEAGLYTTAVRRILTASCLGLVLLIGAAVGRSLWRERQAREGGRHV